MFLNAMFGFGYWFPHPSDEDIEASGSPNEGEVTAAFGTGSAALSSPSGTEQHRKSGDDDNNKNEGTPTSLISDAPNDLTRSTTINDHRGCDNENEGYISGPPSINRFPASQGKVPINTEASHNSNGSESNKEDDIKKGHMGSRVPKKSRDFDKKSYTTNSGVAAVINGLPS